MKRTALISLLFVSSLCLAQQAERVYVSTDRDVYVAGDDILYSVFCLDAADGTASKLSATAYLELHSSAGMAVTGKAALQQGRGCGKLQLPAALPTGNYKLVAYTAQDINENGYNPAATAKTISVFNTSGTERIADGVEIVESYESKPCSVNVTSDISIKAGEASDGRVPVSISFTGPVPASVSIGVRHVDGISAPYAGNIVDFRLSMAPAGTFSEIRVPEYEGEIVQLEIPASKAEGYPVYLSSQGECGNFYTATVKDGHARFFTGNLYGDRDLIIQVEEDDGEERWAPVYKSPFANFDPGTIETLKMNASLTDRLVLRSSGNQKNLERLPVKDNFFFRSDRIRYILDDYTRFTDMEEMIIEFIKEVRVRNINGSKNMQVRLEDTYNGVAFSHDNTLILLDGVAIPNHKIALDYDPMLVETFDVYPHTYALGTRRFGGIVSLSTFKGNMPSLTLPDAAKQMKFQGCSYPVRYVSPGNEDAFRQTLYWDPMVELDGNAEIEVLLPEYEGTFEIVVEGMTADGRAVAGIARL